MNPSKKRYNGNTWSNLLQSSENQVWTLHTSKINGFTALILHSIIGFCFIRLCQRQSYISTLPLWFLFLCFSLLRMPLAWWVHTTRTTPTIWGWHTGYTHSLTRSLKNTTTKVGMNMVNLSHKGNGLKTVKSNKKVWKYTFVVSLREEAVHVSNYENMNQY